MSGHSKWASIKHKKGALDAKRGKIFTRHAKLIEIAAREGGGGDIRMNPSLATAIENAKADNVPNANIERAVKKGTGELKGEQTSAVTFEAYGPGGAAVVIECLTDNKNRTLSNVKSAIERHGGKWAGSGSVMWMFEQKGISIGSSQDAKLLSSEEAELELIDAGAEDVEKKEKMIAVTSSAQNCAKVRDVLRRQGWDIEESGLKLIAKQETVISDSDTAKKITAFIAAIEEDEDVSAVHTNTSVSDTVILH